jgi:ribonuclease G
MKVDLVVAARGLLDRVVLLEDDQPQEFTVEPKAAPSLVGNIYKGIVRKVLPGMEAAFVDIGLERNAFLLKRDILDEWQEFADLFGVAGASPASRRTGIDEMLREGQTVLVRVRRGMRDAKGARVTTMVTLAGRTLVYLPFNDFSGISRRIEDGEERHRLREAMESFGPPPAGGFIVRTAAQGLPPEALGLERDALLRRWQAILRQNDTRPAPACLEEEPPLYLRVLRDLLGTEVRSITVDSPEAHARIAAFLEDPPHDLRRRLRLYERAAPLLEDLGLQKDLDRALGSTVWLRSGGTLVVNPTEALTAIDVNSGKYVGKRDINETALKINLQAVKEVVRQIRLRDLGGIIVIDFIDMGPERMRRELMETLRAEMRRDRSRSRVEEISAFGVVQITRKRLYGSPEQTALRKCPCCGGAGRVKSAAYICQEIFDHAAGVLAGSVGRSVVVRCHPEVARELGSDAWRSALASLAPEWTIQPMEGGARERHEIIA